MSKSLYNGANPKRASFKKENTPDEGSLLKIVTLHFENRAQGCQRNLSVSPKRSIVKQILHFGRQQQKIC